MDNFEDDQLSEYELLRLRNIEENRKQLEKFLGNAQEVLPRTEPVPPSKIEPKDKLEEETTERKSSRVKPDHLVQPLRRSRRLNKTFGSYHKWKPRKQQQVENFFGPSTSSRNMNGDEDEETEGREDEYDDDGEWDENGGWKGWDEDKIERVTHPSVDLLDSPAQKKNVLKHNIRSAPTVNVPPEEITEEDLNNIATSVSEKVRCIDVGQEGTSCHQCRQKTTDKKTICRSGKCFGVRGQFCGVCLKNRYGECVKEALLNPNWSCPPCRNVCNCSICRTRSGLRPTGVLYPSVKAQGYASVHDRLQQTEDVKDVKLFD